MTAKFVSRIGATVEQIGFWLEQAGPWFVLVLTAALVALVIFFVAVGGGVAGG